MRPAKEVDVINLPNIDPALISFSFSSSIAQGTFTFTFVWANGVWNLWVTMPDLSIRHSGVYPRVVNWSGFLDFGLFFDTELMAIGKTDLQGVTMAIIVWG